MKITKRAFEAAVRNAADRRRLTEPVTFRILSVDFRARTFSIDGSVHHVEADVVTFPILNTETVVVPR